MLMRLSLKVLLLLWLTGLPTVTLGTDNAAVLQQAVTAVCDEPSASLEQMAAGIAGSTAIAEEPIEVRGTAIGWNRRFGIAGGDEIRIQNVAPGGRLRRLIAEYWEAVPNDVPRPRLAVMADGGCTIRTGRRLLYEGNSPRAVAIERLDQALGTTGIREPLDPPVPEGKDPGGVLVALVDAGVNYLLPEVSRRLARHEDGGILGYDFWDLDERPFDANPSASPFFPQRHGTKTAALLMREAPMARLVPYRYPRPDMGRMTELISDAAAKGVVVVNMSLGSDSRNEWQAFAEAARTHPQMLFVLSAGNNGRDIDEQPVYPAALPLDNAITVTSSEDNGKLAPGSNWGKTTVDLLVPAERLIVTDFDGRQVPASGSSYAAVRVSALAARLLEKHPGWTAPELKAAIFERVLPDFSNRRLDIEKGFIPRPDLADRLPPLAGTEEVREVARHVIDVGELYRESGIAPRGDYSLNLTLAFFEGTAWNLEDLRQHAGRAAVILSHCDIYISGLEMRVLNAPEAYKYFSNSTATELVLRLGLPKPTVYFVRDTLQREAYDAEAIGKGNSATRPELRYTIWFTEGTRDPGIALAHELAHILMDSGQHVELPGNLMRAETAPENTGLEDNQCRAIQQAGVENALLVRAAGSEN